MPRETVLAGFESPPPNAYGLVQVVSVPTNTVAYGRLRNNGTGVIHVSGFWYRPRQSPILRMVVVTSNDSPIDSAGNREWINVQRPGQPTSGFTFSGTRNNFPVASTNVGVFDQSGVWFDVPLVLAVATSFWVQALHTGGVDIGFRWFEP